MVGFYKHDIPAWMDGTEGLSDGAYRVYHVVVQLIMLNEGPIARNDRGIAGRCNQTIKTFARNLNELFDAGKLTLDGDRIGNNRAAVELEAVRKNRENAGKGGKTRADRHNSQESRSAAPSKPLENNDTAQAPLQSLSSLKEKRREDTPKAPNGGEPEGFEEFRAAYPSRNTRFASTPARKRWMEAVRRGARPAEIIAGAKGYAAEQRRIGKEGTEFVQSADVWLNKQRWRDYAEPDLLRQPEASAVLPDAVWREHVGIYCRQGGRWLLSKISEPPDHPLTKAPRHILAEHNIHPGHARAA